MAVGITYWGNGTMRIFKRKPAPPPAELTDEERNAYNDAFQDLRAAEESSRATSNMMAGQSLFGVRFLGSAPKAPGSYEPKSVGRVLSQRDANSAFGRVASFVVVGGLIVGGVLFVVFG